MDRKRLAVLLNRLKNGKVSVDEVMESLKTMPFEDMGFAKIDTHRDLRKGVPEVVYCPGKNEKDLVKIFEGLSRNHGLVVGTRATERNYKTLKKRFKDVKFHPESGIIHLGKPPKAKKGNVLVVSAGTSDIPVAEEAAVTADILGSKVTRLYDVGVAGLHRLLEHKKQLDKAKVIVVVAGMEGALPSVVSSMVDKPVVAVPTSVGYGASFDGLAALLTMINSCSPGIAVVNIDNGFGAGYFADMINNRSN
jgi:NCAIR mutase (PurE)-related protein